ncbi:hypothetical protein M23134_06669 [Microscilla marina ATCC 23134]|uniref:Uncharacterized protein n=1 Tax=Microscilla marina ATCC 23134 TaxID=313606 RepID=A1ZW47_MICM2|nr:hypothetical protein M23134_06669 [Microscilla marina ATCC 23134]
MYDRVKNITFSSGQKITLMNWNCKLSISEMIFAIDALFFLLPIALPKSNSGFKYFECKTEEP